MLLRQRPILLGQAGACLHRGLALHPTGAPLRGWRRQLWVREPAFKPPTRDQLGRHAFSCSIPMVGFGFMDNVVMIQAGDLIDSTLGLALGLSTLTAAAYGQVVSDVCGTLFGNTIDHIAARLGLRTARLTEAQLRMRRVRLVGMAGAVGGVVVGCLLGMTTLLFKDLGKTERLKRQRELHTLFSTLMEEGHELIGAEHCTLQLVDADGEHLFSLGMKGNPPTDSEVLILIIIIILERIGILFLEHLSSLFTRRRRARSL